MIGVTLNGVVSPEGRYLGRFAGHVGREGEVEGDVDLGVQAWEFRARGRYRGTTLIRNNPLLGPYKRTMSRVV
jgi:hypothetical protein